MLEPVSDRASSRARLSEADQAAWAAYARAVRPLPGRAALHGPAPTAAVRTQPPRAAPSVSGRREVAAGPRGGISVGAQPAGLDGASWRRFRSGRMPAGRRLDLHGFTAQRAFLAVGQFLRIAQAEHVRCVEIVTGRGEGEGGVLRRELPLWLNRPELRPLVLAAAHPHPANPGAVRVLLSRVK